MKREKIINTVEHSLKTVARKFMQTPFFFLYEEEVRAHLYTVARTARIIEEDVISSSTPLEMALAGVHPRCYVTAERLDQIRSRKEEEPYRSILSSMKRTFDSIAQQTILPEGDNGEPTRTANYQSSGVDKRGYGDRIHNSAGYYLVTGDTVARDLALDTMRALAEYKEWGASLIYGHWAHGMACGIDWLWNDISPGERDYFLDTLHKHTRRVFDEWATYKSGEPFGYTWNIMGVILGGLSAAAGVLYGERPNVAPFVNLATEKARCTAHALGDDGVSPEGFMYGEYFATYATKAFLLIRDLVGIDLFRSCTWFKNHTESVLHHLLPMNSWTAGGRCFQFGDAPTDTLNGYFNLAWVCAAVYRDPISQWLGNTLADIVPDAPVGDSMSLFWIDPDISPKKPEGLPLLKHFTNLDIVIGRSGWDGDESAFALKCGPAAGHRGVENYANPLAGGHMHPSSGVVQIFAHGDWILPHPGYTWKRTAYHNCLLVNGAGQRGEESEWFEDLSYRQGATSPSILRAESQSWGDYVQANVGLAYPDEAHVATYYRHLFFVRPDCWVIVDAIEFNVPSTPEILFHTRFLLTEDSTGTWRGNSELATAQIRSLLPDGLTHTTEAQKILHSSQYSVQGLQLLRIATTQPVVRHVFATTVVASKTSETNETKAACELAEDTCVLSVNGCHNLSLSFDPFLLDGLPIRTRPCMQEVL